MFMYLQKNKKGFTLIELMVVVAIIGILALLGLRLYTQQQQKAKDAIVKANAGTVHTLIQSELADGAIATDGVLTAIGCETNNCAGMQNPYENDIVAISGSAPATGSRAGVVIITASSSTYFTIDAYDGNEELIYSDPELVAQR